MSQAAPLGWGGILRLGLVQMALGSIVVLATSTMNRIMVVELALPAMIPAALVALHYAVQILRPRFGFGSDVGDRRTPWIVGGIAALGFGATMATVAMSLMPQSRITGIALAIVAFAIIGAGVGSAGTSLLVLLAKRVVEKRRPIAATMVWLMLIVGFVVTSIIVGKVLDPYTPLRLVAITATVSVIALGLTTLALYRIELPERLTPKAPAPAAAHGAKPDFIAALKEVWAEPQARQFTMFVFISMLAYSGQELILEPFAGAAFGMTPGQSTQLSGVQHGGVLVGMILVNIACSLLGGKKLGSLRSWTIIGCVASAIALLAMTVAGSMAPNWPLKQNVFLLGMANGAFAVSAIGSMMTLASSGRGSREGVRMGLWGAAQAIAFGFGGFLGAAASDVAKLALGSSGMAYGIVFAFEATLFVVAATLARNIGRAPSTASSYSNPTEFSAVAHQGNA